MQPKGIAPPGELRLRKELDLNPTHFPAITETHPPFDLHENLLHHITLLLDQFGHDRHNERNVFIGFMIEIQRN